jgi:hypothetical protein
LHLPQKDEANGPEEQGLEVRQFIQDAAGNLFDGFKLCGLTALDYHIHDGHPNKEGYRKIAHCVARIARNMATSAVLGKDEIYSASGQISR